MRVLIASTYVPFIHGGGTKIVNDLRDEMVARGIHTDVVNLPLHSAWGELPEQTLGFRLLDVTESSGNKIDRLITIRYPSYALRHPNKVAWFIHHHREAYDLWASPWAGIPDNPVGRHYRDMMRRSDTTYLQECVKIFTNSQVVAGRLRKFNHLEADKVLYPPLPRNHIFRPGRFGDYILYASRVNPIKRQELAVQAMKYADPSVKLVIAGTGDVPEFFASIQALVEKEGLRDRVCLTGWVTEEEKAELMAGCCGALYLAFDEDSYGYVTLEAFHSHKPVITLTDSGGSLEVIEDKHNGYVCPPEPQALGEAMSRLWRDRGSAEKMGEHAYRTLEQHQINWDHVIENLTS